MRTGVETAPRDARAEAQAVVGPDLFPRVLEPAPPAVQTDPFADDPAHAAPPAAGQRVVGPVPGADLTWDQWLVDHPDMAGWAADRWLGARRRLQPAPVSLAATRIALHRLAAGVIAPARQRVNGKIGLRYTLGGFGTPFFGADEQVRVQGTNLVVQRAGEVRSEPITTMQRAATFVGVDPPPGAPALLPVESGAIAFLADWYGFAWSVLEELRADPSTSYAGLVQLWPEHFDAAFEALPDETRQRATFGASPGDAAVAEPYLYVAPWYFREGPSALWNASSFGGAVLRLSELVAAEDQRATALAFFSTRRTALTDRRNL